MSRVHTTRIDVEFGDCDPSQIVFLPNFFRWIDASGHRFFLAGGLPPWYETERTHGIRNALRRD
jgi:4-hydroxybenzoyl-CoA thioesterase